MCNNLNKSMLHGLKTLITMRPLHETVAKEKCGEIFLIETGNTANSRLLASFPTKSRGISAIFTCHLFRAKVSICAFMMFSISSAFAAGEKTKNILSYDHVQNWALGLIIVLCLFFACVWLVRKTGTLSINSKTNMKVVSGLSLGMREKLILVQVGEKQLVLGVTPGRIDKLLLLEGNDQLFKEVSAKGVDADFSNKLKQVMAGSENE